MSLRNLSFITLGLFLLSVAVYINENRRGSDLLAGSYYITGLDVGQIGRIVISPKEGEAITLAKEGEGFVLQSHKSYPAATDRINELLFQLTGLEVAEKVAEGASEEDLKAYELDGESRRYSVSILSGEGQELVGLSVGKSYRGQGDYLLKNGEEDIYLSAASLGVGTTYKSFVDTALFSISSEEVEHLELTSNRAMVFEGEGGDLKILGPRNRNFKKEKIDEYVIGLGTLRFEDVFAMGDAEVQGLTFDKNLTVRLSEGLIYRAMFAKKGEDHWVRVVASVHEEQTAAPQGEASGTAPSVEAIVLAQSRAERMNRQHGPWIYKVSQSTFERMIKDAGFFR